MSVGGGSWIAGPQAAPQLAPLFFCDGCQEKIPANKARIHCQTCPDFDLCANCYVLGVMSGNHGPQHAVVVVRYSGSPTAPGGVAQNQPSSPNISQQLPTPSPNPTQSQATSSPTVSASPPIQAPIANRLSFVPAAPVGSPTTQNSAPTQNRLSTVSPAPSNSPSVNQGSQNQLPPTGQYQAYSPLPTPPAAAAPPAYQAASPPPPVSASTTGGWQLLFNGNLPSPIFTSLLNDIFNYLDAGRTGYLTPEAYSKFLDDQGYSLEHNVWKKSCSPAFGQNKEDMADFEWKSSLDNFSIEHIMAPRRGPANNDMSNLVNGMNNVYLNSPGVQQILQAAKPGSVSGGMMPLLTRKGFIDITTIEVLYDPSAGWNNLNRALRAYGIWQDKGPIPREMLPAFPPQAILDQVKRIGEMARYKAQQQIDAKHAELKLKQQGQQAALDLLDDRRYYYR